MARTFGHVPGYPEGTTFNNRHAAHEAGVHRQTQAGITGTPLEGAESIVLNGGYKDDEDYWDTIVYTGHGGQDARGNQVDDQSFDDPGNGALVRSALERQLVRVLRGPEGDRDHSPPSGYRYDGLYSVERYWMQDGLDNFKVCRFLMVKVLEDENGRPYLSHSPGDEGLDAEDEAGPAPRVPNTGSRVARKSSVIDQVKSWHKNQCQICGKTLKVAGGASYSQGAHIRGLGKPHYGPDATSNVLCLCPNDHVLFDNGARYLTDDFQIIDAIDGHTVGVLRQHRSHKIDSNHVRYHRSLWVA
ncbi:putative restriction endonuclease [Catenulispora sp. GP43]|uniref:YDG/SRA domain-containing protein n=1 Tax=Catenulispora sp. GP43 TaxID=3156263 RepID=UPI0035192C02